MNRILLFVFAVFILASCQTLQWQPASSSDQQNYDDVMTLITKIEPYSQFLAAEQSELKKLTPEYYQARWAYLKQVALTTPNIPRVLPQVKQFVTQVEKLKLFKSSPNAFSRAARTLGHELITDKVAFEGGVGNYSEHLNIAYTNYKGHAQKLDLFVPKGAEGVPAVVFIHGGGWQVHKRAWFEAFARYFAQRGYAAVTIDYRKLHSTDSPMAAIHDAKAAVRWVRKHAKEYGIDPNRIGAAGASAGAHLTATLATTYGNKNFEGQPSPGVSSQIQAAVGFATPAMTGNRVTWPMRKNKDKQSWFDQVSLYQHFNSSAAPMKFIHGKKDTLVSYLEAQDLYERYKEARKYSELELVEDAKHVFYMNTQYAEKAREFFNKVFNYRG